MAEDESEVELDRFKEELESLLTAGSGEERGLQSKFYCSRFCELVEEYTGQWHVPLPQLQVLRSALCAFVRGAASFPSDCEHVRYTLSSLALSIFELLLFFGKDEFPEDPLKDILGSIQECHSSLVRYQNVYLLQVKHIIRDGGPWTSPVLEAILKGEEYQKDEVDRYLSSEVALFFELRVRYLLACERTQEAMALAQRCCQHSTAGHRLYFKLAYLSCLWKTSQRDVLLSEMAEIDGKDAVEILCIAEIEEKKELLLELSRGFLQQQLRNGDMYYLWDLVFIWCKLYLKFNASIKDFLEECKRLIQSATNVKTIFPFVRVILSENLGKEGLTFCIELCAQALQTDLKNDPVTKSLIYKTVACLFPYDLEICRACALLVFFLERSVEAYKTVFLLYNHPDQEYHVDSGPIENNVRFEVIQILKKGLFFDPEFWSLLNIKTNCLKLMSDEVARAALCEIMEEDKWVPNYCARGQCTCRPEPESEAKRVAKCVISDKAESADGVDCETQYRTRGQKLGSLITKDRESSSVRRSFRHLDGKQNHSKPLNPKCHMFLTRQAEKFLKRRGRRPRWLVEQLAAIAENNSLVEVKKSAGSPKKLNSPTGDADVHPGVEITTEYSYPDNEVEVPANIQGLSTSKISSRSDKAKMPDPGSTERPCNKAPDSPSHTLLEKSAHSWRGKDSDGVQSQEMLDAITNFHSYATVTEDTLIPVEAAADNVGKTNPPAVDMEEPLERLLPLRNFSEPMKVYTVKAKMMPHIAAVEPLETQQPSELSLVPDEDISENNSAAGSVSDSIHTPGLVVRVSTLNESPAQTTDCNLRCKDTSREAADGSSTSEIIPKTNNTTVKMIPQHAADVPSLEKAACSPGNLPDFPKEGIFANLFAIDRPETPPLVEEAVKQQPLKHELPHIRPTVNSSPTLSEIVHCCKFCNKEYRGSSVLQHALWHYRTEKKCIFCTDFPYLAHPLCHFKKHIKELRNEEPDESVALKLPGSSEPKVPQKKPMPGLAQIKSKLLMRLQLKSKPSTQQDDNRNTDTVRKPSVVEEKLITTPPQIKDMEPKDQNPKDREMNLKEKIRYMTRGVVRKSDPQGRFLRTRLSRKAKSRSLKEDDAKSLSKEGSAHKANGVLRKKPKLLRQKEVDSRAVKEEIAGQESERNKTNTIVKVKPKAADVIDDKTGSNCLKGKLPPESGPIKKKRKSAEAKNDAKEVKKAKLSRMQHKAGQERKDAERENEKEADDISVLPQKKKDRIHIITVCPVVGCGFRARTKPLLAHVLFHHSGDIIALEFCYGLVKNKRCAFCSRIIWSFQHFSDHMVSHQGKLKHLCYHIDCTERFETRLDLSEHMLKAHHPLKAGCCFPECKTQFSSLKFLYHHERIHYKPNTFVPKAPPSQPTEKVAEQTTSGESIPKAACSTDVRTSPNTDGSAESTESQRNEMPVVNNSSVSNSNNSPKLVNGHSDHEKGTDAPAAPAEQKDEEKYPAIKPFLRPPPSAYLDEMALCMPKRWKGTTKSHMNHSMIPESKRHTCSRCSAAFDGEEQLQLHREKCTSLFGFDSDDENAF